MGFKSSLSVTIPTISIPSFVFKSPSELLPDRPAFISLDHPERLSFSVREYRLLSQRFAQGLKDRGLKHGDRVLLASDNTLYFPVIFMGTVMAGGIFAGVNRINSSHDVVRNCRQTTPYMVLLGDDHMDRLDDVIRLGVVGMDKVFHFDSSLEASSDSQSVTHWSTILTYPNTAKDFQWPVISTEEEAQQTISLINASGTSGSLKTIELSHYQLVAYILQRETWQRAQMKESVATLPSKPTFVYMALAQVLGQAQVCVIYPITRAPTYITSRRDFISIQNFIIELDLSTMVSYPLFFMALLKDETLRRRIPEMKSLRLILLTGGPVSDSLCTRFMQMWKEMTGQRIGIRNAYGMTELGGAVYTRMVGRPTGSLADDLMANNEVKVMSLDGTSELEQGLVGELWFRGPHLATGYWQLPEDTKTTFVDNNWIRTGDIGKVDDKGFLIVEGRKKDLIDGFGRTVSPFELEEILLLHPDISNAVVCPLQDPSRPHGRIARAYIIKRRGSSLDANTVIQFFKTKAPHLPGLDGGVSFPSNVPMVSNHKPEREVLMARDRELNDFAMDRGDAGGNVNSLTSQASDIG